MRIIPFLLFARYSLQNLNASVLEDRFHDHLQIFKEVVSMDSMEMEELREMIQDPQHSSIEHYFQIVPGSETNGLDIGEVLALSTATTETHRSEPTDGVFGDRLGKLESLLELLIGKLAREEQPKSVISFRESSSLLEDNKKSESAIALVDNFQNISTTFEILPGSSSPPETTEYERKTSEEYTKTEEIHSTAQHSEAEDVTPDTTETSSESLASTEASQVLTETAPTLFGSITSAASPESLLDTKPLKPATSGIETKEPIQTAQPKRASNNHVLNMKKPVNRIDVSPQFNFHDREPEVNKRFIYGKPKVAWYGPGAPSRVHLPSSKFSSTALTLPVTSRSQLLATTKSITQSTTKSITQSTTKSTTMAPDYGDLERLPGEDILDYFRRVFPSVKKVLESNSVDSNGSAPDLKEIKTPALASTQSSTKSEQNTKMVSSSAHLDYHTRTKLPKANFDQLPIQLLQPNRKKYHEYTSLHIGNAMENVAVTFIEYSSMMAVVIFAIFVTLL